MTRATTHSRHHAVRSCRGVVIGAVLRTARRAFADGLKSLEMTMFKTMGREHGPANDRVAPDHDEALAIEPPIGAHIVTPRLGYTHHGIYVGGGRVVQYGGLSHRLRRGPVEEVSLSQFAQGRTVWIHPERARWSDPEEVVRRARLRLGENRYHVLTNNCEHLCEWCVRGEHRSYQVEELVARYSRACNRLRTLLARVFRTQGPTLFTYRATRRLLTN